MLENNGAWITISVNRVTSPNENDVCKMECPICGKTENIRPDLERADIFVKKHAVVHDCAFILCADCYDIMVDALEKAKETFDG